MSSSNETRKTKFETEDNDFELLSRIEGSEQFSQMNQHEWVNFSYQGRTMEHIVYSFLSGGDKKIDDVKQNQAERARQIIEDLLNTDTKKIYEVRTERIMKYKKFNILKRKKSREVGTVILMDGHGRLVWQLLNYWYNVKQRTDTLKMVVIEYNKKTHQFHEKMLPKDITCTEGDVFEKKLYRYRTPNGDYLKCKPSQMVVYFNFTSVGDQGPKLYKRLASNAFEGISTHWSYMPQIVVKRIKQDLTSTLLVTTHNFITTFKYFYGQIEGKKFISYPVDTYARRDSFYSFRLDFHTKKTCFTFLFFSMFFARIV